MKGKIVDFKPIQVYYKYIDNIFIKKGVKNMSFLWNSSSSSSLFGSNSSNNFYSMVSEMSMIKSGSYKKLLKSYYSKQNSTGTSSSQSSSNSENIVDKLIREKMYPTVSAEVEEANSNLVSGLSTLKTSVSTLQNNNTYKDTENGSTAEDKVVSAMKAYVSDYNNVLLAAKKSTLSSKTAYVANMMNSTAKYSDQLNEIGITVQRNGTLQLNENKLRTADLSMVQNLFSTDNIMSYGSTISSRVQFAGVTSDTSTETQKVSNTSAADLKTDSNALASDELYAKVKDTDGNETDAYNIDKILSTAKSFVTNYNGMFDAAESSSNSGVLANLSYIRQKTSDNAAKLEQFGFSVDQNGRMQLDENKFKESDMSKVQTFFKDYGSFVANYASRVNYYMTTNASASNGYTSNASYNVSEASNYNESI